MTLRTRIAAAAGLAVALAVAAAALVVYLGVRGELRAEVDRTLRDQLRPALAPTQDEHGEALRLRRLALPPEARPAPFGGPEAYMQVVFPDGRVVARGDEAGLLPADEHTREIARGGEGEELRDVTVDDVHLRVLTAALPNGLGAVQVARPLDEIDRQLDRIVLVLLVVGASGVALGAGLGAIVARTALAPVARFTRRTEELAADPDPSERIEVRGHDELARLARSFNSTLDALERSVEAQRGLVADASHELRTPVASLRANIQTLEDAERLPEADRAALRDDIIQELDELTALVADIVELARGAKPGEAIDDVRLDEIVAAVVERARARAGDQLEFSAVVEPTLVRGEPGRIQRAISNLVDNAIKWSPPGAAVELRLAGGELTVRDHGPGFADADLPHVFERFYRARDARGMPGSGLGLAIVRQAAEAHGGAASAANAPGGGAFLRVSFGKPAAASAEAVPLAKVD
jgi:two-component system, OmpR family, sensor histidine kinase MprB